MQEIGLLLAYRLQLGRQAGVLVAALLGLGLRPGLVLVGANLGIDSLRIPDAGLQLLRRFVHQIQGRLLGRFAVSAHRGITCAQLLQLAVKALFLLLQLGGPFPLALVLTVPGKDVLLALNEVIGGNRLGGGLGVTGQFLGIFRFLVGDLADSVPLVIQLLFLSLQLFHLLLQADNAQEGGSLFLAGGLHKPGHIKGQLLHKGIEQLLARLAAGGVRHLQIAVLARPLHDDPVGQLQAEPGREDGALPLGLGGPVAVPAQRPHDSVQARGLALVVAAPNHRQAGGGRGEGQRLNALDVLSLKLRNFD